ncbi:MAG TPA: hypothetical protein G4O16_03475 [Dehalococcoidia bacterium]|nr:hypothetical protein [Dehalococcoidia bacterium]
MGKIFKMILLPLLLISILSLPITLGCNGGGGDFGEGELEQILVDAVNYANTADSYSLFMNVEASMDAESEGEEATMEMKMTMDGAYDQKNMAMYMTMNTYMAMDFGYDMGTEEQSAEIYLVDDYMYVYTDGEWLKMPADEEAFQTYDIYQFQEQIALLESLGDLNFDKYETFNGKECYVIEIIPDFDAMLDFLGEEGIGGMDLSSEEMRVVRDMFDEISYFCWIEKDTGYLTKIKMQIEMKISGDDFKEMAGVSGKMKMDMSMTIEISDYNQPVNINLPSEAENAPEMSDVMY